MLLANPRRRSELLRRVGQAAAEFDSQNLAQESQRGRVASARGGGTPSKPPLGYRRGLATKAGRAAAAVEIDPRHGPIIRDVFEELAKGTSSLASILRSANRAGLGANRSTPFRRAQLRRLLTRTYYKGIVRYAGHDYPGLHQPLVSKETWQRVQELLAGENEGS